MKAFALMAIAFFALLGACSAAHPLVAGAAPPRALPAGPGPSFLRRLAQYFVDDKRLYVVPGPNYNANMFLSRMSPEIAADLVRMNNQFAVQKGDTTYLADAQNTMTLNRYNYDALKDVLNQQVQIETMNAAASGNAAQPNSVAVGTTSAWTTAVLAAANDMRNSMAKEYVQAAVQIAAGAGTGDDTVRAAQTGMQHAKVINAPTGAFNWRRLLRRR